MKTKTTKRFLGLVLLLLLASCVKNLDFDQANDLDLTPTFVVSLVNAELQQTFFVSPNGNETYQFKDESTINFFNNDSHVTKIDLNFEFTNPFNRQFLIDFNFLNNTTVTHSISQISVPANATAFKFTEEIPLTANSPIYNSNKVEVTVTLLPSSDGSIIDINEPKTFIFHSAGTIYLSTKK